MMSNKNPTFFPRRKWKNKYHLQIKGENSQLILSQHAKSEEYLNIKI